MRIALVAATNNSFILEQADRLAGTGLEIHVLNRKFKAHPKSCVLQFHGISPQSCLGLLPTAMKRHPFSQDLTHVRESIFSLINIAYADSVSRLVNKYCLDLIHAHFAWTGGYAGLLAKKQTKKPLIITLHGWDILTEPSVNYGARLDRKVDQNVRKTLKEADALIAVSSAIYKEAERAGAESQKIHLIHNGVDLKCFNPNVSGDAIRTQHHITDKFVVFILRNHEPQYGIEHLIKAIPHVVQKIEEVIFIIGGDGCLRKQHEYLAQALNVRRNTIFTGRISRDFVPKYYAASDVVVVPSLQEGFGLTVAEALACGKPVIGTDVGGIPDQIVNDSNGFIVPPKDPKAIAEKIIFLFRHEDLAKKMGREGRITAERKFDLCKKINDIRSLYGEIQN